MQISTKKLSQISVGITIVIGLLIFIFGNIGVAGFIITLMGLPFLLFAIAFLVGVGSTWLGIEMIADDTPTTKDVDVVLNEELNISEYGPVIGKLDGEDCYEYLVVRVETESRDVKLEYVGPYDESSGFTKLLEGWFVVLNEVLYTEPKEKIEVQDIVL